MAAAAPRAKQPLAAGTKKHAKRLERVPPNKKNKIVFSFPNVQARIKRPGRHTRRAPFRAAPAPARSLLFASSPASAPFPPPRAAPATAGDPQATPAPPAARPASRPQSPPPQHERRARTPGPRAQGVRLRRGPLPGAQQGGGCAFEQYHCGQGRSGRDKEQPGPQGHGQDDSGQGRGGHHVRPCARVWGVFSCFLVLFCAFCARFRASLRLTPPPPPAPSHPARAAPTTAPPS